MSRSIRMLVSLFLTASVILSLPTAAFADSVSVPLPDVPSGAGSALTDFLGFLNNILRVVMIVSGVALCIILAYHGYRIAAAKDARLRQDAIESAGHVVVGGVLIFGGSIVVRLILGLVAK